MISLKSIELEELRKDPNASTAIKKSKIGEGARTKVLESLEEYKDVLSDTFPQGLPPRREVDHKIELLPGSTPKSQALYQMTMSERQLLMETLKELEDQGFIRPSKCLWSQSHVCG